MRYEAYLGAVIERYPGRNIEKMVDTGYCTSIDLIRKAAELLFIDKETDSVLAEETRKQLLSLKTAGITCFDG